MGRSSLQRKLCELCGVVILEVMKVLRKRNDGGGGVGGGVGGDHEGFPTVTQIGG